MIFSSSTLFFLKEWKNNNLDITDTLSPQGMPGCDIQAVTFPFPEGFGGWKGKNSFLFHLPRVADGEKVKSHELCWCCPPGSSHLAAAHPKSSSRKKSQILQNSQLEEQLVPSLTGGAGSWGEGLGGSVLGWIQAFVPCLPKGQEFPAVPLTYQVWIHRGAVGKRPLWVHSRLVEVRNLEFLTGSKQRGTGKKAPRARESLEVSCGSPSAPLGNPRGT